MKNLENKMETVDPQAAKVAELEAELAEIKAAIDKKIKELEAYD